jgi:pyridoxamine 5'-phosphate oxidase
MSLHTRKDYVKGALDLSMLDSDPWVLFQTWLNEAVAADLPDPTAFALSTLDQHGFPHSRIVLLRDTREGEVVFYTNYMSEKGQDLARNPKAGATFFWPQLERQIRIRGDVTRVSAEESDAYFRSRPRASQIGAWASNQSQDTASRETLDSQFQARTEEFGSGEVPRPNHWGGFALRPEVIEFWQGRASRMHDRFRCNRTSGGGWSVTRLQP